MHQILALTADGRPHAWMCWQDAITAKYKGLISFEMGDDENTFHGGISRMTGEQSQMEIKSIVALKGKFKYDRKVPTLSNSNLFARDLHICGYCGRLTPTDKLTRDHIVPKSKGGKDVWPNVISCCKRCNNIKDDHLLEEVDMELIWVPYTPVREEKLIMENRKILADQAAFILGFVPAQSRMHRYVEERLGFK